MRELESENARLKKAVADNIIPRKSARVETMQGRHRRQWLKVNTRFASKSGSRSRRTSKPSQEDLQGINNSITRLSIP
jgi:hypothetical protein